MNQQFMVDKLVDFGRLNFFIQEKHFSHQRIMKAVYKLKLGSATKIDFINTKLADKMIRKAFLEKNPFSIHIQDYNNSLEQSKLKTIINRKLTQLILSIKNIDAMK